VTEHREGFYKDKYGRWQKDRRNGSDRRQQGGGDWSTEHERRKVYRRKADREILEREHRVMIEEALDEFAAEHDGHI